MKFLHTADWHIGKKLFAYDLLDAQKNAFKQMLAVAIDEKVDAVVIAGDLYDRALPGVDAVATLNEMLETLNLENKLPILAISGNHDSATRLETGGPWYAHLNFYLHTSLADAFTPIDIQGVQFYLLPYFEPVAARAYFEDDRIRTIQESILRVIAEMKKTFDPSKKQVLVTHFFVGGSSRSDSETKLEVGGLAQIQMKDLADFTYVALGHLHNPNALRDEKVQYAGSLLKYSVSEANQQKGFKIVEVTTDALNVTFHPVKPLQEIRILENDFATLISADFYENISRNDFIYIKLMDKEVIPDVMARLRQIYPHILGMERVNQRAFTRQMTEVGKEIQAKQKSPLTLFSEYYESVMDTKISHYQTQLLTETFTEMNQEEG